MNILRWVLAALLLISAAIQFNDPDPVYWIAAYAAAAAVVAAAAVNRFDRFVSGIAIGVVVAGMLVSAAGFVAYLLSGIPGAIFASMAGSPAYVEEAREFLGLGIALAALAWSHRAASRQR